MTTFLTTQWWDEKAPTGKVFALLLNDMREPHIENLQIVKIEMSRKPLLDWYRDLAVQPYTDPKDGKTGAGGLTTSWKKYFRRGSELEWFNPNESMGRDVLNDYWGGIWLLPKEAYVGWGVRASHG